MKKSKKKSNGGWLVGVAVVVVIAGSLWAWQSMNKTAPQPAPVENTAQNQASEALMQSLFAKNGQTLPPEIFQDVVAREAYQAAKDVPEVLEQLPCFCGCMQHYGHKNNLFCFMDEHGAACSVCEGIAIDAKKMHKDGLPIEKIRENIIAKYQNAQ